MQERDILISPLDLSHAGDGYPNISTGLVSCRRGISLHLRWTGLILIKDIHQRTCIILRIWISPAESGTPLYTGDMQRPVHCYILQYPTELCALATVRLLLPLLPASSDRTRLSSTAERLHTSAQISQCFTLTCLVGKLI